jgi:hypothetical protein
LTAVPEGPEDVTAEWLNKALSDADFLKRARVATARWERIGQEFGFTGVIGRVHLAYDGDVGDAPRSLIAKLPMAQDEAVSAYRKGQERDPGLVDRYYERSTREARFYRESGVASAPALYHAAFDDVRRRVVLLLEDIDDGRQGDVLRGCTVDEAVLVIDAIAPFHARWWGARAPICAFPHMATDDPRTRQERYARRVPKFLAAYGPAVSSQIGRIAERLGPRLARVAEDLSQRSRTLVHGDLHLDNVILRRDAVVVLDWQTVSVGAPAWDIVLFLIGSLSVADRREAESALFDRYVSRLAEHGVGGYSIEDLRTEARLALLALFAGTVVWLTGLDPDDLTPRERALQEAALNDGRMTTALVDNNVEDLLSELAPT